MNDFEIEDGVLVRYTGPGGHVIIPNGVTGIGSYAFADYFEPKVILSCVIPSGVKWIGDEAFAECPDLVSCVIPDGVEWIGDEAFLACFSLEDITIPDSVQRIGERAFAACGNLKTIHIPDSVTELGSGVLDGCEGLRNEDGFVVFRGVLYDAACAQDETVVIPPYVKEIDPGAFAQNPCMMDLEIQSSITIRDNAFHYCLNLTRVNIQGTGSRIGRQAFYQCDRLEELSIPADAEIAMNAFARCFALKRVQILGEGAAAGPLKALSYYPGMAVLAKAWLNEQASLDWRLEQAVRQYINKNRDKCLKQQLSDGCKGAPISRLLGMVPDKYPISKDALDRYIKAAKDANNTEAEAVLLEYLHRHYSEQDLARMEEEERKKALGEFPMTLADWRKVYKITIHGGEATITGYKGEKEDLVIPAMVGKYRVSAIGREAFDGCETLKSVVIPETVKTIAKKAFADCDGLKMIKLPIGLQAIEEETFSGCSSLKKVIIPQSVETISDDAFRHCWSLTSFLTEDGNQNFKAVDGVLFDASGATLLCYPRGRKGKYIIPNGVKEIGPRAFLGCKGLTGIVIPEGVEAIDEDAFDYCEKLRRLVLPESIKAIGRGAFSCWNLKDVTIYSPDVAIDPKAFFGNEKTIRAPIGSTGQKYAKRRQIHYEPILPPSAIVDEARKYLLSLGLGDIIDRAPRSDGGPNI